MYSFTAAIFTIIYNCDNCNIFDICIMAMIVTDRFLEVYLNIQHNVH